MRPTGRQAQEILREEIDKFTSRIDFMMDLKVGPRTEAREISWWRKDFKDMESATTDRNIAFLRAYVRIGGAKLFAEGLLLLDKGRVYMDRSVIRRLERDGFITFHDGRDPYFSLTAAGLDLIAE
jgi:hypothetical protein